jgi:hypothetical protein
MSQTMLYKLGGEFEYEGECFTYTIVNDEDIDEAIASGFYLTTTEAIEKAKKQSSRVIEIDANNDEQEPAKRRGRPAKVAE